MDGECCSSVYQEKRKREDTFTLCSSVKFTKGNETSLLVKNRLYQFDASYTWEDVLYDLMNDEDFGIERRKTDKITVVVTNRVNGAETFEPDMMEEINVVKQFDPTLKFANFQIVQEGEPVERENDVQRKNAFSILMNTAGVALTKTPKLKDSDRPRFTAKDRLYNDVVREMEKGGVCFPSSMSDGEISRHVDVITGVLWYIDGNHEKLASRSKALDDYSFPERFVSIFEGYNDWKKNKKKTPILTAQELKHQSTALFQVLVCPFTASWGEFKTNLENVSISLDQYAAFLQKSNEDQQRRQAQTHPVRDVYQHTYMQFIEPTKTVDRKYSLLDTVLSNMGNYEYLYFDEDLHVDGQFKSTFDRYDFVRNVALSHPIQILKYNPGGSVGMTMFLWKVPEDGALSELMNESMRIAAKLKPQLPEYHTRRMRKEFEQKYCGLHTKGAAIPKHILRAIYAEMSLDATADQNPAMDARVRQAVLSGDADLVLDLRHLNKGRPGDTFQQFFDVLATKVDEMTAADERRHNIEHMSKYVSVKDLIEDVKKDLPQDAPVPSESTVLFSFAPKNAYLNTAKLYKSKIALQHKVQTRQLRLSHEDNHFCAAQYKYMRQFAHKFKEEVTFLSIDDKSKVDYGEPRQYISTGVRGKKSIVPANSTLSALDHDVSSRGSITPSVCLDVDIPEDNGGSFYRGSVFVTYKDSVFQPSSPWRHMAEIQNYLQEKETVPPILMLFSDGGPDHRVTYHAVKLSLIVLFRNLDLDLLVAGRTAPGHSWLNPVERIMSTLNIAMQNVALAREECKADMEQVMRATSSMADIRKKADKVPGLKQAWLASIQPIVETLEVRTEKMALKGQQFHCLKAASDDRVSGLEGQVHDIDANIVLGHYQTKDLKSKADYQRFLSAHCIERQYLFQVRKCGDISCCRPKRGTKQFPWVPDPVPDDRHEHFRPFDAVLGTNTTDAGRPSSMKTTATAVAENLQGAKNSVLVGQNVRRTVDCYDCRKPRCIYAKRSLTFREDRAITRMLEKHDFTCGALLVPEGDVLHGVAFVRLQINCNSPIEFPYYSTFNLPRSRKDICCYCTEEGIPRDENALKEYRVVLPVCDGCRAAGHTVLKRNPIKN